MKKKKVTLCGFCQNDLAVKDHEILNLLLSCVVDYALNIIGAADWFPKFCFQLTFESMQNLSFSLCLSRRPTPDCLHACLQANAYTRT